MPQHSATDADHDTHAYAHDGDGDVDADADDGSGRWAQTRRRLLQALGATSLAVATATGAAARGSADDEKHGDDDDDDGDETDGGKHTEDAWCPLDSQLFIEPKQGEAPPITYDVAVTGELELPDGQRTSRARGEVQGGYPPEARTILSYSGSIKRLSVDGPGTVRIEQVDCDDGKK